MSSKDEWEKSGKHYVANVTDVCEMTSSAWLRESLLKPSIVKLLGNRSKDRVLDVGTGGGWLFKETSILEKYACDLAKSADLEDDVNFVVASVEDLPFPENYFDAIVASIVLCYCSDLTLVARELFRVAKPGGRIVVALVHPTFYRIGKIVNGNDLLVDIDLSKFQRFEIMIGGTSGPFTYYKHRVSDYLNKFARAGWILKESHDHWMNAETYEKFFRKTDMVSRCTKTPVFLAMSFIKTNKKKYFYRYKNTLNFKK